MDTSDGPISALGTWTRTGREEAWIARPVTDSDVRRPGAEAVPVDCHRSILAGRDYVRRNALNLRRGVVDRRVEDGHCGAGALPIINRASHAPVSRRRRGVDDVEELGARRITLARPGEDGGNSRARQTARHSGRGKHMIGVKPADTHDPARAESC